jgi:hypothetical protein
MEVTVKVPAAFSVREENELYAFQHLMARLNPQLQVTPVATGMHVNGGCTVFWGLVHSSQQSLTREDVEAALRAAGFNFKQSAQLYRLDLATVALPTRSVAAATVP